MPFGVVKIRGPRASRATYIVDSRYPYRTILSGVILDRAKIYSWIFYLNKGAGGNDGNVRYLACHCVPINDVILWDKMLKSWKFL